MNLKKEIKYTLKKIVLEYPEELRKMQTEDIERVLKHILWVYKKNARILDIGGGIGLFSLGCALMGMEVYLLDDFRDFINIRIGESILNLHKKFGVNVIKEDALKVDLLKIFEPESIDVVTLFDVVEHFHHSPRDLFHQIRKVMKKGGKFIIGVPNSIDIFNRIKMILGISPEAKFEEWYYNKEFRGHIREMTISELIKIARDLGFRKIKIYGENWNLSKYKPKILFKIINEILKKFKNLCSDIYLLAEKS